MITSASPNCTDWHFSLEDPSTVPASVLVAELSAALKAITGDSGTSSFQVEDVRIPGSHFAVMRSMDNHAVGCGALRPLKPGVAELKRMYIRPAFRSAGGALLEFLEKQAWLSGYLKIQLETRAVNLRAVQFYEKNGYRRIENFGKYRDKPEAICFEKILPA